MRPAAMTRLGAMTWLLALPISATAQEAAARLPVQLVDRGGLPRATVAFAREVTTQLYRRIGVEIVWVDDITPVAQSERSDDCCLWRRVAISSTASLVFPAAHANIASVLGITPRGGDHPGQTAYVFADPVLGVARTKGMSVGVLLGYVIAHELGHSLLPYGHTTGLMRETWTLTDLAQLNQQTLAFQPDQAHLIWAFIVNRQPQKAGIARPIEHIDRVPIR